MSVLLVVLALVFFGTILFVVLPASTLSKLATSWLPAVLAIAGILLILGRQFAPGSLLLFLAAKMWQRNRPPQSMSSQTAGAQRSNVRSDALEMELDHETGAMNGVVLSGQFRGSTLDDLSETDLHALRAELSDDGQSLALLDAYLDRRFPAWRENADADVGAGQTGPSTAGTMSQEEAYEVLGLSVGATVNEIRLAHRRLMKTAHPDSGGSTFLASKINEAKDVLLRTHS